MPSSFDGNNDNNGDDGFVDALDPVEINAIYGGGGSGGGGSSGGGSGGGGGGSGTHAAATGGDRTLADMAAGDVPEWMQSLGALPQSSRVDRSAINQNFTAFSSREADASAQSDDSGSDGGGGPLGPGGGRSDIQRSLDKREINELVQATRCTVVPPIPADPDLAAALAEDVRTKKVEVVNWKFWKKPDDTELLRERLKTYCRRYEGMLLKHSKLLSKRYDATKTAREEAAREWSAKELQLVKWAKHRYLPLFRRLHDLLMTRLDQLMKMDVLAATITNNRCRDSTAMYQTLKQYSPSKLEQEAARKKKADDEKARKKAAAAAKSGGSGGGGGAKTEPGSAAAAASEPGTGSSSADQGPALKRKGSHWDRLRASMKEIATQGHPWIDTDFFMTLEELLARDSVFQASLEAHARTTAEFATLQEEVLQLTPKLMPMRQLDRSRQVTAVVNGVIKAGGVVTDMSVAAFNGIVLDRRNFEGRLMARWQEGYLEKCTSVPPDAIIVFVEHIASLVTKNYLNTQHLDESGKDALKEVMQKLAEAMIYPLPAVRAVCNAYNLSAVEKMDAAWRENLAWVKELPPDLIKIDAVFIHQDYVTGKVLRPYIQGTELLRKSAQECVPFRCIEYLLEAVKVLHDEAAAACVSNGSEVLPMGAEDLFPILVYACIHSGVQHMFASICFAFYYGTDSGQSGNSEGSYYTTSWMAAATWVVCLRRLGDAEVAARQKALDDKTAEYEQLPMEGNTLSMDQDEDEIDEAVRKLKAFSDSNQHFEDTVNAIL